MLSSRCFHHIPGVAALHITFVSLGMELLGVEYLSSYVKAGGHQTSLAHNPALFNDRFQLQIPWAAKWFDQDDQIVQRILDLKPDLLAFSCLTNVFQWSLEIARRVREQRDIPTIFGGVHPSAVPEFVMGYDQVDMVCQGEGEEPLLQVANALQAGRDVHGIDNIWSKKDGEIRKPERVSKFMTDLNALPFPDKELFAPTIPEKYVYRMMTGRGCPYRCTFCFNNFFANLPTEKTGNKQYVRRRSVENCLEELRQSKRRYNFSSVEFHDDIFTMDKDWLKEFLPRFKEEIGVPWICETHAKFMDDELAQLMKDTGCAGAKMGIQSLERAQYKSQVLKRAEKERDIIKTFDAFRKANLQLDADHILGLPDESDEALDYALEFYRKHTPSRLATFFLTYFPAVEITEKAHASGEITDEEMENIKAGNLLWYHQVHATTPAGREKLKRHAGFMIAFQILPAIPRPLRRFVKPEVLARIPFMVPLSRGIMATKMMVDWLVDGNFGALMYLRLYTHHMFGKGRKLNRVPPPETKLTLAAGK